MMNSANPDQLASSEASSFSRAIINPGPAEPGYPDFANSVNPDQLASEEAS